MTLTAPLAVLAVLAGLHFATTLAQSPSASCSGSQPLVGASNTPRSYDGSVGVYNAPWMSPPPASYNSGAGKCITWQYTPATAGNIYFSTCGLTSDDTVLVASTGACTNDFGETMILMLDDTSGCQFRTILSFEATAGTRYFLHMCTYASYYLDPSTAVKLTSGQFIFDFQCPAGMTDHDSLVETACISCTGVQGIYAPVDSRGACSTLLCPAGTSDDDSSSLTPCVACGPGTDTSSPGKYGLCTNFNVPAGKYDHDSNSATAALTCPAGNYAPAAGVLCTPCAAGSWDHDGSSATACVSCASECVAGYYESPGCTPTTNRACATCTPVTSCAASSTTCTSPTTSRCSTCLANFYKVAGPSSDTCEACAAACTTGTFETADCTATSNRVCTACTAISDCDATVSCTSTSNGRCSACASGHYLVPGSTSAQDACAVCETCGVGTFESQACTHATNRNCTQCTPLENCAQVSCTDTTDSVCVQCHAGSFYNTTSQACHACVECASNEFEAIACTFLTDRSCSACANVTNCASVTCTSLDDSVCESCTSTTYMSPNATAGDDEQCLPCAPVAGCAHANVVCTTATDSRCNVAASSADPTVIIVVVVLAALLLIVVLAVLLVKRRQRRNARKSPDATRRSGQTNHPATTMEMLANPLSDHGVQSDNEAYSQVKYSTAAGDSSNLYDTLALGGRPSGSSPRATQEALYDNIRPAPPAEPVYSNTTQTTQAHTLEYEAPKFDSRVVDSTAATSPTYEMATFGEPQYEAPVSAVEAYATGSAPYDTLHRRSAVESPASDGVVYTRVYAASGSNS
ncbi:hypothetical protein CAOG_03473 [Capsaspora owczarzaki ATCC 30864]|uniref:TNFR-Cys domain-containing protein n=1 Tax=Capsaspora owczarzaki (strain ATCC 30864) TaxID=595528 RepID=A0A0D2UBX1_CAPO3|nr:hypothetical protein CAOG_03473 [Capsaspora owczarzaki ATCC 30864]KJE92521.1 hypothetical protein CAOG_003473 [Capsaspora owczarzaki ATCC 30864]|eukprot:XP_004348378.1 hypothetical protein CAOG_03473 [Capsaspora owczarzaki ATCC 30864]